MQGEIDECTTIFGGLNIFLSVMDKSIRQKISKNTVELNSIINQLDIIDIYGILHLKILEYTFFLSS